MADPRKIVKSRLTEEQAKHVTYWDEMRSSFAKDRDAYLRERADLNKAAEDARAEEEKRAREMGLKRRKDAGY